jgi:ribosomal protein S18
MNGSKSGIIPMHRQELVKKKNASILSDNISSLRKKSTLNDRAQVLNLHSKFEKLKNPKNLKSLKKFQSSDHKILFRSSMGTGSKFLVFTKI